MNNSFNKSAVLGGIIIGAVVALLFPAIAQNIHVQLPLQRMFIIILPVLCVAGLFVASQLGKAIPVLYQIAKFGLVGILNTAIDFGVVNAFILVTGIADSSRIAVSFVTPLILVEVSFITLFKAVSFTAAVINSYFWNKFWTFGQAGQAKAREFSAFLFVSIVGFGINLGTATLVINFFPRPATFAASQWDNVGFLAATLVALTWNFVGYKFWVFARRGA